MATVALLLGLGALSYAAVILLVDPFGLIGTRLAPPFGLRPNDGSERTIKALEIASRPHSVLLVGNSRVQLGLDPRSPELGGALAYNAGLPAATISEQVAVVRYALRNNRELKTIVWALDDDAFAREGASDDFARSPLAGRGNAETAWQYIAGGKAAIGIPKLLWRAARGEKVRFDGLYILAQRAAGLTALRSFDLALRPMANSADTRPAPAIALARISNTAAVREAVAGACARGINVHLLLPPFHVWYSAVFAMSGLAATSDAVATRHDLSVLARNLKDRFGVGCIDVWDFTGYEAAMTTEVPADRPSALWWDAIHFRTDLGEELLACALRICNIPSAHRLDLLPDSALDSAGALPGAILANWKREHPETVGALAARFGLSDRR